MALLSIQQISPAGVVPATVSAAGGGDTFVNNGKTFLKIVNGSGSPITVTVNSLVNCNQGFDHNVAVAVGAGETQYIGPFSVDRFNSAAGIASVTYSGVSSLTVAAISL